MKIKRVDHVGLVVRDLDKSLDFYSNILGFSVEYRMIWRPGLELIMLTMGEKDAARFELLHYSDTDPNLQIPNVEHLGLNHLSINVDDLASVYNQMIEKGVEITDDQPFLQPGGARLAFVKDPDGLLIEFIETKNS